MSRFKSEKAITAVADLLHRRGLDQAVATSVAPVIVSKIVEDDPNLIITDEGAFYQLLIAIAEASI